MAVHGHGPYYSAICHIPKGGNLGPKSVCFLQMRPFFFHRYNHIKNVRWGPVYLAQVKQLPAEVQTEFD